MADLEDWEIEACYGVRKRAQPADVLPWPVRAPTVAAVILEGQPLLVVRLPRLGGGGRTPLPCRDRLCGTGGQSRGRGHRRGMESAPDPTGRE
jgi:hypothetical protein